MLRRTPLLILVAALSSCGKPAPPVPTPSTPAVTPSASPQRPDLIGQHLDRSVSPGADFFQYANGAWIKANPIPADESSWSIGHEIADELYAIRKRLCETSAKAGAPEKSDARRIGDFWTTGMDAAKADALGIKALHDPLHAIEAADTLADLIRISAMLQEVGVGVFWGLWIGQDSKQSDLIAVNLWQGGLGLPDRDYYFNPEAGVAHAREEYPRHIGRILKLAGLSDERAAEVMKFETRLAKASRTLEAQRDPYANYNRMAVAELAGKHTPHLDWRAILDGFGLKAAESVIVGQPEFFDALDQALGETPLPVLKDYLRFHVISEFAPYLGSAIAGESFSFFGRELQGAKEQRPRWKRVLDAQERAMGWVLAREFVKQCFPESTKKRYAGIVESVRGAYRRHLATLDWMSEPTRKKALEKIDRIMVKVGYPDVWKDCSALEIGTGSFVQNMVNAAKWRFEEDVRKFGRPVNRADWDMTPQTYNAYYNPSNNEIVLPAAAFLIPGLADADIDDAVAYGYAGASTIGHEITHGFDDEGRKFDADGNLKDWWTKEDAEAFEQRAAVMAAQFDAYEPVPGIHINGKATLGENIADFGGIVLGLEAFKTTEQYRKGATIGGLTPVQRFCLGYALGWLGHTREEKLRQQLLSDVHSPAKWRVNGPFANVPDFHAAFGVKPGDPMWRGGKDLVRIW